MRLDSGLGVINLPRVWKWYVLGVKKVLQRFIIEANTQPAGGCPYLEVVGIRHKKGFGVIKPPAGFEVMCIRRKKGIASVYY